MKFGAGQISIMRSTTWGRWYRAPDNRRYRQCMRLHGRGLLERDPQDAFRFTATTAGQAAIIEHDAELPRPIPQGEMKR